MIVYTESNFVLELALAQEQSASCQELVRLAQSKQIQLSIPAFCFAEPQSTLHRRKDQRRELERSLNAELAQIARTVMYADRLKEFKVSTALLAESAEAETTNLRSVVSTLLACATVIPLDPAILSAAAQYETLHNLRSSDAIVYASVLGHLTAADRDVSCFLNRNARDFDDPDIQSQLKQLNCRLIPRFDDGLEFVKNELRHGTSSSE